MAEQLQIYQETLKDKNRQMKSMASELNMYQVRAGGGRKGAERGREGEREERKGKKREKRREKGKGKRKGEREKRKTKEREREEKGRNEERKGIKKILTVNNNIIVQEEIGS